MDFPPTDFSVALHRRLAAFSLAALNLAALSGPVVAAPAAPPAPMGEALGCLIKPSRVVELGSPVIGIIQALHVGRGDTVKAQQRVATLRDEVERATVGVANARATAEAELDGAAKNLDVVRRKLARTEDLARQGFLSAQAVDQVMAERQAAEARHALATEGLQQARRELQVASAQLDNRTVRSPISGVVIDVYRHPGERVEDRPIAKIATVDPLHVELVLPAAYYGLVQRGESMGVQPQLPGLAAATATVEVVDPLIDPGSNTLRVRLTLANPEGRIPAGIRCRALLKPELASANPLSAPSSLQRPAAFKDELPRSKTLPVSADVFGPTPTAAPTR